MSELTYNRTLHYFAVFTAVCTFFLIIAGGLVTSTGSGLAVPDWPLSYGKLMPPMVGGIFYEHGHRMVATFVGFLTLILAVWIARKEDRRWVKILGYIALAAVVTQGLLGGLTVMLLLPTAISVSHATLAQTFFATVSSIALFTSKWWREEQTVLSSSSGFRPAFTLAIVTTAAIYIQLILGALMRHTQSGLVVPDFPLAYGQLLPSLTPDALASYNQQLIYSDIRLAADGVITAGQVSIHMLHRLWALVVAILLGWTIVKLWKLSPTSKRLRWFSYALGTLVAGQITLGAFTVLSRKEVYLTTAHVATGALLLATSVLVVLHVARMAGVTLQSVRIPILAKEGAV